MRWERAQSLSRGRGCERPRDQWTVRPQGRGSGTPVQGQGTRAHLQCLVIQKDVKGQGDTSAVQELGLSARVAVEGVEV